MKKNFIIKYKAVAGEQLSLKMEGVVDVPLFNMLALIYEMEGYTSWMPFCTEAKEVIFLSYFVNTSLPSDKENVKSIKSMLYKSKFASTSVRSRSICLWNWI